MEKALGHIVQNLGVDCLKDSKRFSSAIADLLPGFEYEAERKALCACICSEVSEKIINEKQYTALNSCVKYLTSQQKLTEQQANELVKVLTHVLWKEASSGSSQVSNSATKNTVTSQATVIHSTTADNTSSTKIGGAATVAKCGNAQTQTQAIAEKTKVDLRKAAEQGRAAAQCGLGDCYYFGNGVSKDYAEAVKWYRKAAEQGYADAQYKLGKCYYYGYGVSEDCTAATKVYRNVIRFFSFFNHDVWDGTEAIKWYCKAAEQDHIEAQYDLGFYYCFGCGVSQDKAKGAKWCRKAAEHGYIKAQFLLGFCYDYGWGVSEDSTEATKWYRKAANQGDARAKYVLGDCCDYPSDPGGFVERIMMKRQRVSIVK